MKAHLPFRQQHTQSCTVTTVSLNMFANGSPKELSVRVRRYPAVARIFSRPIGKCNFGKAIGDGAGRTHSVLFGVSTYVKIKIPQATKQCGPCLGGRPSSGIFKACKSNGHQTRAVAVIARCPNADRMMPATTIAVAI